MWIGEMKHGHTGWICALAHNVNVREIRFWSHMQKKKKSDFDHSPNTAFVTYAILCNNGSLALYHELYWGLFWNKDHNGLLKSLKLVEANQSSSFCHNCVKTTVKWWNVENILYTCATMYKMKSVKELCAHSFINQITFLVEALPTFCL